MNQIQFDYGDHESAIGMSISHRYDCLARCQPGHTPLFEWSSYVIFTDQDFMNMDRLKSSF
jgi:hypothetical protein